jgi:hypothetical protein
MPVNKFIQTSLPTYWLVLFVQALATAGAFSMLVFQHSGAFENATYMSIANLRDSLGLSTTSRVYKWTSRTTDNWKDCSSPIGKLLASGNFPAS